MTYNKMIRGLKRGHELIIAFPRTEGEIYGVKDCRISKDGTIKISYTNGDKLSRKVAVSSLTAEEGYYGLRHFEAFVKGFSL